MYSIQASIDSTYLTAELNNFRQFEPFAQFLEIQTPQSDVRMFLWLEFYGVWKILKLFVCFLTTFRQILNSCIGTNSLQFYLSKELPPRMNMILQINELYIEAETEQTIKPNPMPLKPN